MSLFLFFVCFDLVTPEIKAWIEYKDNTMVAVCRAENGNPAANISWNHARNSSVQQLPGINGLFTVESRLELPEGIDPENLSCTISHQNLNKIVFLEYQKVKGQASTNGGTKVTQPCAFKVLTNISFVSLQFILSGCMHS